MALLRSHRLHKLENALHRASFGLCCMLMGCAHAQARQPSSAPPQGIATPAPATTLRDELAARDRQIRQLESRLALLEAEQRQQRYALRERKPVELGVRETVRIGERGEAQVAVEAPRAHEARPVLRLYEERNVRREETLQPVPHVDERLPVVPLAELVSTSAKPPDVDLYVRALDLLRQRDFLAALSALNAFLQQSPDDARVGRALFWRGEALFAQKHYRKALAAFEEALAREPQGEKAADALLKIGLCHQRLGSFDRARGVLDRLKQQFPDSQAARVARAEEA